MIFTSFFRRFLAVSPKIKKIPLSVTYFWKASDPANPKIYNMSIFFSKKWHKSFVYNCGLRWYHNLRPCHMHGVVDSKRYLWFMHIFIYNYFVIFTDSEFFSKNEASLHAAPSCENEECLHRVLLQVY